jgi:hypothetical protein
MITPINTFKITTAVKIQTVLDAANPTSVTIEIEDGGEIVKVNYATMSQVASKVYQYVWQSVSTDDEGQYKVTIKAVYGSYTSTAQAFFVMEDID